MADEWIDGPPPGADDHGRFPVGVLLQVKDQGLVLVGHMNDMGGLCNDCPSEIRPADVERHRFVWREPADVVSQAAAIPYAEMFDASTQNPERRLSPEQEAAYARAEEIMRTHGEGES